MKGCSFRNFDVNDLHSNSHPTGASSGGRNLQPVCYQAPTTSYTYVKIANGGYTGWRPAITEVQLYSDTACTVSIAIPAEGGWDAAATVCDAAGCDLCSGWDNVYGVLADKGPQLAFDGSTSTAWRPQCYPCNPGAAWIKFRLSASTVVQCVKAANLGDGSGGGQSWDGGLEVSTPPRQMRRIGNQ